MVAAAAAATALTCNNVTLFLSLSIFLSFFLSLSPYLFISISHSVSLYNPYLTIQSLSHYTISISLYSNLSLSLYLQLYSLRLFLSLFQYNSHKGTAMFSNYLPFHFMFAISLSLSLSFTVPWQSQQTFYFTIFSLSLTIIFLIHLSYLCQTIGL